MSHDLEARRALLSWLEYARELGIETFPRPLAPVAEAGDAVIAAGLPARPAAKPAAALDRMRQSFAAKPQPGSKRVPEAPPVVAAKPASGRGGLRRLEMVPDDLLVSPPADPGKPGTKVPIAKTLADVRAEIGDCTRCRLHQGRTNLVFGVGNPAAELMFVGEGPGRDEDEQGEPFVGRAGQLLNDIIKAIGMKREDVYIANVVKCRPPENRTPLPDEAESCRGFLFKQINLIKPKVIVALGKPATETLLRSPAAITKVRGQQFNFFGAVLVPTFHPAYLLRNPPAKREVWEDMKLVRDLLSGKVKAPVTGEAE